MKIRTYILGLIFFSLVVLVTSYGRPYEQESINPYKNSDFLSEDYQSETSSSIEILHENEEPYLQEAEMLTEKPMKARLDSRGIYWPDTCEYFSDRCLSSSSSSEAEPVYHPRIRSSSSVWKSSSVSSQESSAHSSSSSFQSSSGTSSSAVRPMRKTRAGLNCLNSTIPCSSSSK